MIKKGYQEFMNHGCIQAFRQEKYLLSKTKRIKGEQYTQTRISHVLKTRNQNLTSLIFRSKLGN
uniref:Uncharacterized protein n=1 Tax=Arundo donax TaxID=35708 RepID=A0A0A9D4E4_ARUDO